MSNKIYLDYAATTPLDPEAEGVMLPYFKEKFGNPGSLHSFGQEAIAVIDGARETIAESIGADFREIIFTGSATEANNLVLRGVIGGLRRQALGSRGENLKPSGYTLNPRIIVSAIEHESVLETARDLEREGVEVIYLSVDKNGFVDLEKLKESLNERTVLVSIMYANNEIGIIQPIAEISKIIRNFKKLIVKGQLSNALGIYPLFHSDAVQAFQYLDCDANKLGVDLMTLSAHKIYGPKGVGALYARPVMSDENSFALSNEKTSKNLKSQHSFLSSMITGGGQEFGLRSGTENVPAIAGFAKAVELVSNSRESENSRMKELSNYFWQGLKKIEPKAEINGGEPKLPNILNIYFPDKKADDLLIKLDMAGIAVSSGSACSVRSPKLSHVLGALGLSPERVRGSLRFSFGRFTTREEVDEALKILNETLNG